MIGDQAVDSYFYFKLESLAGFFIEISDLLYKT
jgi:hypothetical protein